MKKFSKTYIVEFVAESLENAGPGIIPALKAKAMFESLEGIEDQLRADINTFFEEAVNDVQNQG